MVPPFDPAAQFDEVTVDLSAAPSLAEFHLEQRFPQLIGGQDAVGAVFAAQKVVIVGAGSVGRRIALHATRLGVGQLRIIDPGQYDDGANLLTQEILATEMGATKVGSVGNACKRIHSKTQVFAYQGNVQDLDPVMMAEADVLFLSTDNLAAELEVSNRFRLLGVPIVQASVHGETLVAQVRFIENRTSSAPCLMCGFGPEEYGHLNRSTVFRCSGHLSGSPFNEQQNATPTMSTSFLCSMAADFALMQWTRHTLTLGQPVVDSLLQYCGYTHKVTQADLPRKRACRGSHMVLERAAFHKPLADSTTEELAEYAGFSVSKPTGWSITLGELSYIRSAICGCKEHRVERFSRAGVPLGTCTACGGEITPQPYYTFRPTPGSELRKHRGRPLKELGVPFASWAVVHDQERGVLLREESA